MSRNKRKIDYHEHDTPGQTEYPGLSNVASATECTGLMYRVPMDQGELESYQELSSMEIPKGDQKAKDSVQYKLHESGTAEEAGKAVEDAAGEYSPRHMKK